MGSKECDYYEDGEHRYSEWVIVNDTMCRRECNCRDFEIKPRTKTGC
jgi:hypothetical protein